MSIKLEEIETLKEELKTTQDIAFELTESLRKEGVELEKLKKSRDGLLEALKDALECAYFSTGDAAQYLNIIQKAQNLKDKV